MIKMMHPQHGFHMASSLEEVDMRKNGWVDAVPAPAEPSEPEAPVLNVEPSAAKPVDKRPYNRKAK